MAKQGQKLDDELKERIRAALVISDNWNEIAKTLKVSWSTVQKIAKEVKSNPDENEKYEKLREDKRQQMIDRIWESMTKAATLGDRMIQEALDQKRDIPLNHISTFYGTMYDKHALMTGGKTGQFGVSGGLDNTTTDLTGLSPDERRARIDELNRKRGNGTPPAS
jgi:transposase